MKLVLRNVTSADNRRLPPRYHSYVVLRDGVQIGRVAQTYRPKTAGGTAWAAHVPDKSGREVTVYAKTIPHLCEIMRHIITGQGPAPSHWR